MCREKVKSKLREAEKEYMYNQIHNNPKKTSMWKVIRNYIPRKETTKPIYSRNIKTLADEFNIFFTSVGVKASEASAALVAEHNLPTLHRYKKI